MIYMINSPLISIMDNVRLEIVMKNDYFVKKTFKYEHRKKANDI